MGFEKENSPSLKANQILEAAASSGVLGNLRFETLLTSSFHVIDTKLSEPRHTVTKLCVSFIQSFAF